MNRNILILGFILLIGCLSQFASDVYTPAIPAISESLTANINHVQLSLSIYLFAVALSLLVYAPISESYGRKIPVLFGLAIMFVGTIICFLAQSAGALIVGRIFQGLGAGACAGIWRAIFRDVFQGEDLAKYGSYLSIAVTFIIPAAPILGALLLEGFGWRSIFIFISIWILIAIITTAKYFDETSQHHDKANLSISKIASQYKYLFTHRLFIFVTLSSFICYGAIFSWFVVSPVLLIEHIGISPASYGWLNFLGSAAAFAVGGLLNSRLVRRYGIAAMLRVGWSTIFTSGMAMAIAYAIWGVTFWAIVPPIILFFFGLVFIWPNLFATAMQPFSKMAGYAGCIYSFMQLSGGAVIATAVAYTPDSHQGYLAFILIASAILAWLSYEYGARGAAPLAQ